MGYLAQVNLHLDAPFHDDPSELGRAILSGIDEAHFANKQVDMSFKNHANYISVEPPRHADHKVLFISSGNAFSVIGRYENDWETLVKRNPKLAKAMIKEAKFLIKLAEEAFEGR